jgi:hypothetical protein
VDAGNSRVGINNSNPTYALDVTGGIRASSLIQSTSSIDFEGSIGGVYLRPVGGSSTTTVEAHIRPQSGKKGYLTFTEDTVADRWAIGIENANSTLFFRPGQTSTAFSNYFTTDGTLGVKQAPGNYTVDVTDGQTSFANNATVDFPNASGMLVVNNHTDGSVTIYLCGGGGTSVVSTIGTQVGTFTYVSGISGYRWTNTYGSTAVFGFFFLRTRTTA